MSHVAKIDPVSTLASLPQTNPEAQKYGFHFTLLPIVLTNIREMYKTTLYSSSESVILRKNKCDGPLPPHDSDPLTQSKVTSTRL